MVKKGWKPFTTPVCSSITFWLTYNWQPGTKINKASKKTERRWHFWVTRNQRFPETQTTREKTAEKRWFLASKFLTDVTKNDAAIWQIRAVLWIRYCITFMHIFIFIKSFPTPSCSIGGVIIIIKGHNSNYDRKVISQINFKKICSTWTISLHFKCILSSFQSWAFFPCIVAS